MVDPDPNPDELWGSASGRAEPPPVLLEAAGLRSIVLCASITEPADDPLAYRDVGGTIDPRAGAIWLTVTAGQYQDRGRIMFAHELYHLFERATDGELALRDPAWNALTPDFQYGDNPHGRPGFVSAYAATNAIEDKAETFARFAAFGFETCEQYRNDSIVLAKAVVVRDRIAAVIGDDAAAFLDRGAPCL